MQRWKLPKKQRKMPHLSEIYLRKEKKGIRQEVRIPELKTENRAEIRSLLIRIKRVILKMTEVKKARTETIKTEALQARTTEVTVRQMTGMTETRNFPRTTMAAGTSGIINSRALRKMIHQAEFLCLTA